MDVHCYFCSRFFHTYIYTHALTIPSSPFPVTTAICLGTSNHWRLCLTLNVPKQRLDTDFYFCCICQSYLRLYASASLTSTPLICLCSLSMQEMIIDKVNGQPVPRYLIYDIIKFNVSSPVPFDSAV